WALAHFAVQRDAEAIRRAGIPGEGPDQADALFDAILAGESGVVFAVDEWEASFGRVGTEDGRLQLAVPELFDALQGLATERPGAPDASYPFVLSAGERRSFTANTILRNPEWRRKDAHGALRVNPGDAQRLGIEDGGSARITTRRGSAEVEVEVSDRMQAGHVSLPNGMGLDFPDGEGEERVTGVSLNELTASEDRDWLAGTPWHKYTPARLEAL
ncbi:MAG: molybdopterin dinucleotide binding domain-containing protein, partial [Myxococcota bacterium]